MQTIYLCEMSPLKMLGDCNILPRSHSDNSGLKCDTTHKLEETRVNIFNSSSLLTLLNKDLNCSCLCFKDYIPYISKIL